MGRIATGLALGIGSSLILASLSPFGAETVQVVDAKRMIHPEFGGGFHRVSNFRFLDVPFKSAGDRAMPQTAVSLSGTTIASIAGQRLLVLDSDSGTLLITDEDGKKLGAHKIRPDASQLVVDNKNKIVFVADRANDRIWKLAVGDTNKLTHQRRVATHAEPFGLALTPDGKTLLVSHVADRKLVAYDTEQLAEQWSLDIPAEARGVAVSPDGKEAVVTHLLTGTITHINLANRKAIDHTALNVTGGKPGAIGFDVTEKPEPKVAVQLKSRPISSRHRRHKRRIVRPSRTTAPGNRFARNAFAATYLPNGVTAIAYQESTPQQVVGGSERVGTYGGGFDAPINHRIAFVGGAVGKKARRVVRAEVSLHQPRAIVYSAKSDTLYVAALGNDQILAVNNASTPTAQLKWQVAIPAKDGIRCGPSGLVIGSDNQVRAFCSFSRRVVTVNEKMNGNAPSQLAKLGDELTRSRLSKKALLGKQLFHQGSDFRLSTQGAMACASCHPEGRTDGLSWRIEGHSLQTPLLIGGRLAGTHPFKWDGKDRDLTTSLTNTVRRLGGNGITKVEVKNLQAFFDTLPKPRTPTSDRKAVARGEKLFRSKTLGCDKCHSGKAYTNGKSYELADDLGEVDTPSLIGLASSAPYYHDGSASDLRALLNGKGDIHGMGGIDRVKPSQFDDLIAFLESL